jgi:hypothetical protein
MIDQKEIKIIQLREGLWSMWETQIDTLLEMQGSAKWLDRNMASEISSQWIQERPTATVLPALQQAVLNQMEAEQKAQTILLYNTEKKRLQDADAEAMKLWEERQERIRALANPTTWREIILKRYMDGKMDLYEYQKEMESEDKPRGTIRKTCAPHLQDLIKNSMTVPQIKEMLKEKTCIVNGAAIKMYNEALWGLAAYTLEETPEFIRQFEAIVECLESNSSKPSPEALKEAFLGSFEGILPALMETLSNDPTADLETCKRRVIDKSKGALLKMQMLAGKRKMENQQLNHAHISDIKSEDPSDQQVAMITRQERFKTPRSSTGDRSQGVGPYGAILKMKTLQDVGESRLKTWKLHADPNHTCDFKEKCWFKSTPERMIPAIKLFLDSLKTTNRNPFLS